MDASLNSELAAAGLPSVRERQQALPVAARGLHQVILKEFTVRARPPARAELAPIAAHLGLDAGDALAHLAGCDLLVLTEAGEIAAAYPFSATPTNHHVEIAGGPVVSAMCAIDALGIAPMTGRDAVITSTDPSTGEHIRIDVRDGQPHARPADAVVSCASTGQHETAARACCPLINFHASPQAAARFRDSTGLPGAVLSLPEATLAAARLFGDLLHPDP